MTDLQEFWLFGKGRIESQKNSNRISVKAQNKGQFKGFRAYNKALLADLQMELKAGDLLGLKASQSLALERLAFDLTGKDFLA